MEVSEHTYKIEEANSHVVAKGRNKFFKGIGSYIYLLPAFIFLLLFVFYPFFKTIYLSLFITDPKGFPKIFAGLGNYIDLLASPSFLNSLRVTFEFALIVVPFSLSLGLFLAILANSKLKGIGVFRIMFTLPMAVSSACASIIWTLLFHPTIGLVNYILHTNIGWLTDSRWVLVAVTIVTIWLEIGINFIFSLAGLQNIPTELYESAEIDGANALAKHIHITLPLLSPTIFFLIIINIINVFQAFGQINIMTLGGPGDATNVLVFRIYRDAFFNYRFGTASAESIILFIILFILTIVQFRVGERSVFYK